MKSALYVVMTALLGLTAGQYYQHSQGGTGGGGGVGGGGGGGGGVQYYNSQIDPYTNRKPPPAILMHKQALSHDGSFKFIFAAENGLKQGESIAPDGSRTGGYSYVTPEGKTITVKYSAGKDGFRILDGSDIPKTPEPVPQQQQYQQQQYQQPQSQYNAQEDDGQYRESHNRQATLQFFPAPSYSPPRAPPQQFKYAVQPVQYKSYATSTNSIQDKEPDYDDAPGKPHSFGTGYSFEFGG